MFLMTTYLNQLKMYNFSNCTTEHCVGSIFCRVSHGIEYPISAPNGPSLFLNLFNQLGLVLLLVGQNGWEQKLALVYKVSTCTVYRHFFFFFLFDFTSLTRNDTVTYVTLRTVQLLELLMIRIFTLLTVH